MPRIGIDATNLSLYGKGVSRFQQSLIQELANRDNEHEFYIFINARSTNPTLPQGPNLHYVKLFFPAAIIWEQLQMTWVVKRFRLDLMQTTTDRLPLLGNGKFVLYLFEIPSYRIDYARQLSPRIGMYRNFSDLYTHLLFPHSLKKASLVVTSSNNTKRDVETHFGIDGDKVQVVYAAADNIFQPPTDSNSNRWVRSQYGIKDGYVLHLSSDDPRDNTETVLKAFSSTRGAVERDVKLVIGGKVDPDCQGFNELIRHLGLEGDVYFVGYRSGRELVELYQDADVYVDPSLYEGFGFQVVEAMACGTPVITSNVTSLPELVGDAGVLLPPNDVDAWAHAMERVLGGTEVRDNMSKKGLGRARNFTWQKVATELSAAYDRVLKQDGSIAC